MLCERSDKNDLQIVLEKIRKKVCVKLVVILEIEGATGALKSKFTKIFKFKKIYIPI